MMHGTINIKNGRSTF